MMKVRKGEEDGQDLSHPLLPEVLYLTPCPLSRVRGGTLEISVS